jgi:hypothetical protein
MDYYFKNTHKLINPDKDRILKSILIKEGI